MRYIFSFIFFLIINSAYSQYTISEMPFSSNRLVSAVIGDTLLLIGGDDSSDAHFYSKENGYFDKQEYGSDGFSAARLAQSSNSLFLYDLGGVNLVIRDYYKYDINTNSWSDGQFPKRFNEDLIFQVDNLLYSFDFQRDSLFIFNIDNETAERIESPILEKDFGMITDSENVYLVGGRIGNEESNQIAIFNKATKEWSYLETIETYREPNLALGDNKLFIFGGFNAFSNQLEIFDLQSETSSIFEFPVRNDKANITYYQGKVIIAGGNRTDAYVLDLVSMEVSEPYTFEENPNISVDKMQIAKTENYAIFSGGRDGGIHLYDSKIDQWTTLDDISFRTRTELFEFKGSNYIAGGLLEDGSNTNELIQFDFPSSVKQTITTKFSISPNPSTSIFTIQSTDVQDVKVYNTDGAMIYQGTDNIIDLGNFYQGIYYVKVKFNSGSVGSQKIIKL